jgi:hypothetical protein
VSESPGDLAVAFRSFGRRYREAVEPLDRDPATGQRLEATVRGLRRELEGVMASAAATLKAPPPTDDLSATGATLATAISAVPADAWEPGQLDQLRRLALEAGQILRRLDEAVRGRS